MYTLHDLVAVLNPLVDGIFIMAVCYTILDMVIPQPLPQTIPTKEFYKELKECFKSIEPDIPSNEPTNPQSDLGLNRPGSNLDNGPVSTQSDLGLVRFDSILDSTVSKPEPEPAIATEPEPVTATTEPEPVTATTEPTFDPTKGYTIRSLKAMARAVKIPNYGNMTKSQLLEAMNL